MSEFTSLIDDIEELLKDHRLFGIHIFQIFKPRMLLYDGNIVNKINVNFFSRITINLRRFLELIFIVLSHYRSTRLLHKVDILVLGFSTNHYMKNLAPILSTLRASVFGITAEYSEIQNLHSVWRYYRFIPKEYHVSANESYSEFRKYLLSDKFLNELIERNSQLNRKNLRKYIKFYVLDDFKRLLRLFIVIKYIIDVIKPSKLVTSDEIDQRCRFILLLAQSFGIESICVQQGTVSLSYMEWRYAISDTILVFGEESKRILVAQGVSPKRICIVGNPAYDHLPISNNSEEFYLFASQPYYEGSFASADDRNKMLNDLVNYFIENNQLILLIKPHPHECIKEWDWIKGKYANIQVCYELDISTVIAKCGVFITFYSTCTYEAILHNKPIICIQYLNSILINVPFVNPIVEVAFDDEELYKLITKFSHTNLRNLYVDRVCDKRREFIRQHLFSTDRQASNRAGALIERDM